MCYSKIDNMLDVMKKTLQWRHIAPTCPDTVPSTPCIDTDPFIMYNCPAVYFCGNCDEFATDLYNGKFFQTDFDCSIVYSSMFMVFVNMTILEMIMDH